MILNKLNINTENKSQITVYIILGIVALFLLIVFLLFINRSELDLNFFNNKHPVTHYVEECMRFNIVKASEILTNQGGFIYNYNPNLTTTKRSIAYSVVPDNNNNRLKNTAPTKDFMELEIERYIEKNIEECVDEIKRYKFEKGEPKAEVIIYPESVYAKLKYPLKYIQVDKEYNFNDFSVKHEIPLGRMIELRDVIIDDLVRYPNLMLLDKLYDTDFEMYVSPYSNKIKVIEMINTSYRLRNDPLAFTFAIKDLHTIPPALSFDYKISNTTINVNDKVKFQVKCNHKCEYYDDTIIFDINKTTGIIEYTPSRLDLGEHKITITISDDTYKVMDTFYLRVVE